MALRAAVLDELEIQQVPVLLGTGRSLRRAGLTRRLDLVRVIDAPRITYLRYRVVG